MKQSQPLQFISFREKQDISEACAARNFFCSIARYLCSSHGRARFFGQVADRGTPSSRLRERAGRGQRSGPAGCPPKADRPEVWVPRRGSDRRSAPLSSCRWRWWSLPRHLLGSTSRLPSSTRHFRLSQYGCSSIRHFRLSQQIGSSIRHFRSSRHGGSSTPHIRSSRHGRSPIPRTPRTLKLTFLRSRRGLRTGRRRTEESRYRDETLSVFEG